MSNPQYPNQQGGGNWGPPGQGQPQQPMPGYGQAPVAYAPAPGYGYGAPGAAGMVKGGFWIRLVAYIIDAIILGIVVGIFSAIDPTIGSIMGLVAWIAYPVIQAQFLNSTSVGKMAMGLRIVDANGSAASMGTLLLRNTIGYLVSGIILYIGFIMIGFDAQKQGLHDKIAKTYVVKK